MIIVKLMGGLGNQMFQYAAGYSLALKHSVELKLDTSFLLERRPIENLTYRNYELSCFLLNGVLAKKRECNRYLRQTNNPLKILRKIYARGRTIYPFYFKENKQHYNTEFKYLSSNVYLEGYWQTERYFQDYALDVRKCFQFRDIPIGLNAELIEKIRNTHSISLHIRRGDYITNSSTNHFHGVCSIDYYMRAIELIALKVKDPYFFVFSDDIRWAEENIVLKGYPVIYFNHNGGAKSYEDMRLMSNCKHNIIANSTFSWWAAWLNNNQEKVVIAPGKWFNDPTINIKDIIPEGWIKL